MTTEPKVLYIIVCAAGPAGDVGTLVKLAQDDGWTVQLIATPPALDFIDVPILEKQTGRPVRSQYRKPGEPRSPRADAIIVSPATYNTINKFAQGISDTYALGLLAEAPGLGIPVIILPFVNRALASRAPFRRSIQQLRDEEGTASCMDPASLSPMSRVPGTTSEVRTPGGSRWSTRSEPILAFDEHRPMRRRTDTMHRRCTDVVLLNCPFLDQGAAQARRWPAALGLLAGSARHRPGDCSDAFRPPE